MATVEGGAFECTGCDDPIRTESVAKWNQHCKDNPRHTESGATPCITCGIEILFDKLPYHPIDEITGSKNISLRCDECSEKILGNSVRRTEAKLIK